MIFKDIKTLKLYEQRQQLAKDLSSQGLTESRQRHFLKLAEDTIKTTQLSDFDSTHPYTCHKCYSDFTSKSKLFEKQFSDWIFHYCPDCGALLNKEPNTRRNEHG